MSEVYKHKLYNQSCRKKIIITYEKKKPLALLANAKYWTFRNEMKVIIIQVMLINGQYFIWFGWS